MPVASRPIDSFSAVDRLETKGFQSTRSALVHAVSPPVDPVRIAMDSGRM